MKMSLQNNDTKAVLEIGCLVQKKGKYIVLIKDSI